MLSFTGYSLWFFLSTLLITCIRGVTSSGPSVGKFSWMESWCDRTFNLIVYQSVTLKDDSFRLVKVFINFKNTLRMEHRWRTVVFVLHHPNRVSEVPQKQLSVSSCAEHIPDRKWHTGTTFLFKIKHHVRTHDHTSRQNRWSGSEPYLPVGYEAVLRTEQTRSAQKMKQSGTNRRKE